MIIDVEAKMGGVNLGPQSTLEEIMQNVRTILTTQKGSVPLFREFGITQDIIDEPTPVAQAKYTTEIIKAVQQWEPRAKVTRVKYSGDGEEGKLVVKVQVKIEDGT